MAAGSRGAMDGAGHARSDPISVWVVEDDDDYRALLGSILESDPALACPASFASAEDLLAHLNQHFAPEVLILDIGLPGMSGVEAVQHLRMRHPGSRIIMLTIHEDNDRIFDAIRYGASGYLAKGASADDITQAVHDVMAGGAAMSPQIARRVLGMFTQSLAPAYDYGLTDRERDVLSELVKGKSKKRIADDLFLSRHTVDTHLRSVYLKLHVSSATEAVGKAVGERLV